MTTVSTQCFSSCWHFFVTESYSGGMDLYVQEFGVNKTHDEFYIDLNIRAQLNKFVQFIVERYANEPTVMAWELANDPRCNLSVAASASCNTFAPSPSGTQMNPVSSSPSIPITWLLLGSCIFCRSRRPSDFDLQERRLFLSELPQVIPAQESARRESWLGLYDDCLFLVVLSLA